MDSILRVLHEICIDVRNSVSRLSRDEAGISLTRGAGGDVTKRIDKVGEDAAIDVLRRNGVRCTVLSEEAGLLYMGEAGRIDGYSGMGSDDNEGCFIVLDAIDGTTNAVRGLPFYSCSVAYATSRMLSSVTHAAVMDLTSGDMYYAVRGKGAYLNGVKISTSAEGRGMDHMIGMNLSGISVDRLERVSRLLAMSNHIRQMGSNALEMCLLARGLLDAYIDIRGKIRVTDIAAAYLIVIEAGGIVVDEHSNMLDAPLNLDNRLSFIASANQHILNYILSSLD